VQSRGKWDVTAVAPERLPGDLRDITLEPIAGEACTVRPVRARLKGVPHLRYYDKALASVLEGPWDVVHVWEEPYVAACAQIAAAAPATARVVPATFQNIVKRYPPPLGSFERRVMRRAAGWIAFGRTVFDAQRTKPLYAARPGRVIAPGVDVCRFRPDAQARAAVRARLGWNDAVPVVGFLGRFVAEKGLATLMNALDRLGRPWHALFVGGGPMAVELSAFAAARGGRVQVVTGVAHEDVPAHLNAMDVLCAPSEATSKWREQFGRMVVEAMACGVAVLASRSGEIPHVVGDAAVLADERQAQQWTEALDRVLGDPEMRSDLSARGLARVHDRFALPVVARAHLEFFEELL
jgi:glycosyltransferase involved in cell wall biosynthesis